MKKLLLVGSFLGFALANAQNVYDKDPYKSQSARLNYFLPTQNPKILITDADGNLITDTDDNVLMMSSNDYMDHLTCVYDIEYKKGWYDLKTYFETDKLVEDV